MNSRDADADLTKQDDAHLAEIFVAGEDVFKGNLLHVVRDTIRLPNGRAGIREYIKHPGAACIVAEFEDGKLLLERQYRYPMAKVMIEFPAGKLDRGENPLVAAQRELKEETGYWARSWHTLGHMHPLIAYADEITAMIADSRISDGKTIVAFFRWQLLRRPGII